MLASQPVVLAGKAAQPLEASLPGGIHNAPGSFGESAPAKRPQLIDTTKNTTHSVLTASR